MRMSVRMKKRQVINHRFRSVFHSAFVTTTGLFHDPLRIGQSKHSTQTAEAVIGFFILITYQNEF